MFRRIVTEFKQRVAYYRAIASHPKTPRLAKWLLVAAIAYALSPIDLIPDWIPVIGYLDDLVIVPGLVALAVWMVPKAVKDECRHPTLEAPAEPEEARPRSPSTRLRQGVSPSSRRVRLR